MSKTSNSDYPEHLNPFWEGYEKPRLWKGGKLKRTNSFGETLRNSFLFKSFRPKKKIQQPSSPIVEIRRHEQSNQQNATLHRQTLPSQTQPLLPRSRFSERVAHLDDTQNNDLNKTPEIKEEPTKEKPLPPRRTKRRKRKAPLPPAIGEDETSYTKASSEYNLSEWSLTSVGTDLSAYSESEHLNHIREDMVEIMNITKEVEKLTRLSDNNESEDNYKFVSQIVYEIIDKNICVPSDDNSTDQTCLKNSYSKTFHNSDFITSSKENLAVNQELINSINSENDCDSQILNINVPISESKSENAQFKTQLNLILQNQIENNESIN